MVHCFCDRGGRGRRQRLRAHQRLKARLVCCKHMPDAVILRPSIVFGPEDQFFNRFAGMTRFGPLSACCWRGHNVPARVLLTVLRKPPSCALTDSSVTGVYELGGPDVATFCEMMQTMLGIVRRRRLIVNVPFFVGRIMGFGFGVATNPFAWHRSPP